jgi:hypothetical protein
LTEKELDALLGSAFGDIADIRRRAALQAALRQVRPYLHRKQTEGGVLIDFFHRSLWKATRRRYVPAPPGLIAHHRDLAAFFDGRAPYAEASPADAVSSVNYRKMVELAWQRLQIVELGRSDSEATSDEAALVRLLFDWRFLEAKYEAGLVFELAQEIEAARQLVSPDRPEHAQLALIEEALRRDIHFVARHRLDYPQALFQASCSVAPMAGCRRRR